MSKPLVREVIAVLEQVQLQQSDTKGCASNSLDQVIQNLRSIYREKCSEQEIAAMALQELAALFLELPEVRKQFDDLAKL